MPVRRLARRPADLGRRHDIRAVLDRPGAQQHLPVVAPGPLSEVGGHGQDLGAGQGKRAVQLGEAQVVADRQAQGRPDDLGGDQSMPSGHARRLGVTGPVIDGDVEQVELAVERRDGTVGRDQRRAVERPGGIRRSLGRTADQDPGSTSPGDLGKGLGVRPGDWSGRGTEAVIGSAVLQVFRQGHETGSVGGRLVGKGDRRCDVRGDVGRGVQLDHGD
jgi:hypothetical protein